ncbi:MAG: gonadoliberin III [Gammaproteobacteria bacterium]|nr:MAG: gonadoliberin III [Gammaproteobacteria bacterium]
MVLLLAAIGVVLALLRNDHTGVPFTPGQSQTVWQVEARIDFEAEGSGVVASLHLPKAPPGYTLFQEQTASPGYGFSIVNEKGERRGEWTRSAARGRQTLYYSAQFLLDTEARRPSITTPPPIPPVFWEEAEQIAARQLLAQAQKTSASAASLARELISRLHQSPPDQNAALLLSQNDDENALLVKLLHEAGVPARSVLGLYLEDARRRQSLTPMVEVHTGERWVLFQLKNRKQSSEHDLLLWQRGGSSLLDVTGASHSRVSFSMLQQTLPAEQLSTFRDDNGVFSTFSLQRLPIEEQGVFKLLLLLPLGAAVVVFMRVIVGLRTSGTFMPILVALAFLQTELFTGLASFITVVAIGLAIRSYLSRLNLLLVARIATLIVLVIFLISLVSILGYQLGYSAGLTVTFFPMIIIAWTIERMSILWEEEGSHEVFIQGSGSLLVAIAAYLLMNSLLIKHLTFNFPELNLVLLAAILAMGQYTGYKLSELHRFRAMTET